MSASRVGFLTGGAGPMGAPALGRTFRDYAISCYSGSLVTRSFWAFIHTLERNGANEKCLAPVGFCCHAVDPAAARCPWQ